MAYLDRGGAVRDIDPWRLLLGIVAAPVVPPLWLALAFGQLDLAWMVILFGFISVVTLYLPLILLRLPHSRRPLLACVLLGAVAGPGPVGYALAAANLLMLDGFFLAASVLVVGAPLGAAGGLVFWLCVVWRGNGKADSA